MGEQGTYYISAAPEAWLLDQTLLSHTHLLIARRAAAILASWVADAFQHHEVIAEVGDGTSTCQDPELLDLLDWFAQANWVRALDSAIAECEAQTPAHALALPARGAA